MCTRDDRRKSSKSGPNCIPPYAISHLISHLQPPSGSLKAPAGTIYEAFEAWIGQALERCLSLRKLGWDCTGLRQLTHGSIQTLKPKASMEVFSEL